MLLPNCVVNEIAYHQVKHLRTFAWIENLSRIGYVTIRKRSLNHFFVNKYGSKNYCDFVQFPFMLKSQSMQDIHDDFTRRILMDQHVFAVYIYTHFPIYCILRTFLSIIQLHIF